MKSPQVYQLLKERVDEKKYINISRGAEIQIGVTRTKLKMVIVQLKEEGYNLYYIKGKQIDADNNEAIMILAKPDVSYEEVCENRDTIISESELRKEKASKRAEQLKAATAMALRLKDEGHTTKYISYVMGMKESTIINILKNIGGNENGTK